MLSVSTAASGAPIFTADLVANDSEVQILSERGTSGQYRLRFGDGGPGVAETTDIPSGSSAAVVQAALNALSNISAGGGSVTVLKEQENYRITFDSGPLAGTDVPLLVAIDGTTPLDSVFPDKLSVRTVDLPGVRQNDRRLDYRAYFENDMPAVARNPQVGDTVGCWGAKPTLNWTPTTLPARPSSFTFEWWRNGVKIAGATDPSYVVAAADAGAQLQCLVYAHNSNNTATSVLASLSLAAPAAMVVDPQPSPAPPAPPTLNGAGTRPAVTAPVAGNTPGVSTRRCTVPGTWTVPGGGSITWSFQWLRNGQEIAGASASGGTTFDYTITAADLNAVLQCRVTGRSGTTGVPPDGGKVMGISTPVAIGTVTNMPTVSTSVPGPSNPQIVINAAAPVVEFELPAGPESRILFYKTVHWNLAINNNLANQYWTCTADEATLTCSNPNLVLPQDPAQALEIAVRLGAGTVDPAQAAVSLSATGADTATAQHLVDIQPAYPFGIIPGSLVTSLIDAAGDEYTTAGGHPYAANANVELYRHRRGTDSPVLYELWGPNQHIKQLKTDTPPGVVGNPLAPTELCDDPAKLLEFPGCPRGSYVGEGRYSARDVGGSSGQYWARKPVVALEPERGVPAQFAFADTVSKGIYVLNARLRPEGDYAVSIDAAPISQSTVEIIGLGASICSYGANVDADGLQFEGCKAQGDPGAFDKPLLTNPTACDGPLETKMWADSWENPNVFSTGTEAEPAMTDCANVPFTPTVAMSPTSEVADSPSGLDASIDVPADGLEDPNGISQSHLKKTVVELPPGVSVNPSAATGLKGCADEQLGLKTDSEPTCPDGSKLGTVSVTSPVLEETLSGVMVLRTPKSTDPQSGEMLRVALIVRNDERGVLVKLPGSAVADSQTGRLTATFDDNPQLPIGHVEVHMRGGDRGVLAMGRDCGELSTKATLTPWSGNADAVSDTPLDVDQRCGDGFAPRMSAGNGDSSARGQGGTFGFRFSRQDGEQWLRGLTAKLPSGLLASVKDVPLCANAAADAGNCPAGSKIGVVDAKAGTGDPFVLEEKGEVFLTEGYKGGEYGLAVKIRPVAGPFRGEYELSPIVVRQAIHVDRTTAEVTAISDPFPLIHHGIPLRAREINVLVNRGGFMVNPSDCTAKQTSASLVSDEGATASLTDPFQVSGCADLPFKPKLTLALTGRRQVTTGKHPGVKAVVTQAGTSEAGIEKAVVRLPKSLALDPNNAQALCEFADGTKPDLEKHCPKGSIVGRARAKTPLLRNDLVGNVYFVKNVRRDPTTGNLIRTLPMLIVALRGEISINLKGESSTTKGGKLVNTFASVPDAPISQFNLNVKGGKSGILAVTQTRKGRINVCAARQVAEADIDGHNGRRHDVDVRMKTPCAKRKTGAKRSRGKAGRR